MANIVVIAPHPDDAEIGMGGTIAQLAEQGHRVTIVDVTDGCPTPHGDRPTRLKEAAAALGVLKPMRGAGSLDRVLLDLPNRRVEHTLEARHKIAGVYRACGAEIVFLPHPEDAHPDHRAVTRNAEDARFDAKLTGLALPGDGGKAPVYPKWMIYYYCSHLRKMPDPTWVMDTSGFSERKIKSIRAYASQFVVNEKNREVVAWVEAADRFMGSRIGTRAGEGFFMKEPIGLKGLGELA